MWKSSIANITSQFEIVLLIGCFFFFFSLCFLFNFVTNFFVFSGLLGLCVLLPVQLKDILWGETWGQRYQLHRAKSRQFSYFGVTYMCTNKKNNAIRTNLLHSASMKQ